MLPKKSGEKDQLIPSSEEGLVSYWPFDEGPNDSIGSTTFDVTGNGRYDTSLWATVIYNAWDG